MKKRLFVLLTISMVLLMFLGVTVYAVQAGYAHTPSATSMLTISSSRATCISTAQGDITVNLTDGTQYLKRKTEIIGIMLTVGVILQKVIISQ